MKQPLTFRKRPVEIEAIQWNGDNVVAVCTFMGTIIDLADAEALSQAHRFDIETLEGTMSAIPGDWIIRGVKGEYYPCKPDIFAATYETV